MARVLLDVEVIEGDKVREIIEEVLKKENNYEFQELAHKEEITRREPGEKGLNLNSEKDSSQKGRRRRREKDQ